MSIPTQPSTTTICTEALKRFFNGGTPASADITRAESYGMEKVKRDIMSLGRTWRPLLRTAYDITADGVSFYSNPTDFEANNTIGLMSGSHSGLIRAYVDSSSATLAVAEDATQTEVEGKWLLVTSGTGVDQAEQVDDYSASTKLCTLRAALATTPVVGDGYLIVNDIKDLIKISTVLYDKYEYSGRKGTPVKYAEIQDDTVGKIALYPVPNAVFGLRRRYYADLRKLDTAITLYNTILRRWAHVLEQGVYVWKLGEDDDRWMNENQTYQQMLMNLVVTDLDGFDPSLIAKGQE